MKTLIIMILVALALPSSIASACSILNEEEVQIGTNKGIKGICSNNQLPITCIPMEDSDQIQCEGPSGVYSGTDPHDLVFSACGCSEALDEQKSLEKQWQIK